MVLPARTAMAAGAASGRSGIPLPRQGQPAQLMKGTSDGFVRPSSLYLRVDSVQHLPSHHRRGNVVLRDGAGNPCAYGGRTLRRYWVRVPDVGSFELSADGREVRASVLSSTPHDRMLHGYYGTALPLFAQAALGFEVLHASAVLLDGVAVAFSARTGVGKSTIASAFKKHGFALWADDAVAFATADHESPTSVFLPFMREGQTAVPARDDAPLGAVCLLERFENEQSFGGAEILRASPADSLARLLSHAYRFADQATERRRQMVRTYVDVVARIPVLLVRFASDRDRSAELVGEIESAVKEAGS
jgi:hypothetical protein